MIHLHSYMSYQEISHIIQNSLAYSLDLTPHQFDAIVESRSNDPVLEAALRFYPITGMRSLMNKELDRRAKHFVSQSFSNTAQTLTKQKMREFILSKKDLSIGEKKLYNLFKEDAPGLLLHVKKTMHDWILNIKKTDWVERMLFKSNPHKEKKSDFIKRLSDYIDFIFSHLQDKDAEPEFLVGAVLFIENQSSVAHYELMKILLTILNEYSQICKNSSHQYYPELCYAPMSALADRLCEMWQDHYLAASKEEDRNWSYHYVSLATHAFIHSESDLLYHLFYQALQELNYYTDIITERVTIRNTVYEIDQFFQNYICDSEWERQQPIQYIRHFAWKIQVYMLEDPLSLRLREFLSYSSSSIQAWIAILDDYPELRASWHKQSLEEHKKILIDLLFESLEIVPDKIQMYLLQLKVSYAQIPQKICTISLKDHQSLSIVKEKMSELGSISPQHLDFLLQITEDSDLTLLTRRFEKGSQPPANFLEAKTKITALLDKMTRIQHEVMRSQPFMTYWIIDAETSAFLSEKVASQSSSWLVHNTDLMGFLPCRIDVLTKLIQLNYFQQHVLDALFFQACKQNWGLLLPILKEKGARFYVRDDQGQTPLMVLAEQGQTELLKFLLANDRSGINAHDLLDETALIKAAKAGHYYSVHQLLFYKALTAIKNSHQETAFLCAIKKGHDAIADLILNANTPVNTIDSQGNNALFYAIQKNNLGLVKKMIAAGVYFLGKRKLFDETMLMAAIKKSHYPIIRVLLEHDVHNTLDVLYENADGDSALILAVRTGDCQIVELLSSHIIAICEAMMKNRMSRSLTEKQRWDFLGQGFLEARRLGFKVIAQILMKKIQSSFYAMYYGYALLSFQNTWNRTSILPDKIVKVFKITSLFHKGVSPLEPSLINRPVISTSQKKPVVFSVNPCLTKSEAFEENRDNMIRPSPIN